MTVEEYQLLLAQSTAHAYDKILACQVRAAENAEAQTKAELDKANVELTMAKQTANRVGINTANHLRPSMNFNVCLLQSEDGWTAEYGSLCAYGDTPELAFQKFDEMWTGRYEP